MVSIFENMILKIPARKLVFAFFIVVISIILLVLLIFAFNFHDQQVSKDVADWGVFGDFMGGVLNPVISLASLIILGYITLVISKESTKENKNLFLFERSMVAYQEFTSYLPKIELTGKNILDKITLMNSKMDTLKEMDRDIREELITSQEIVFNEIKIFSEFYYYLESFNDQYGLLFKYDFSNHDFLKLIICTEKVMLFFDKLKFSLGSRQEKKDFEVMAKVIELQIKLMKSIIFELKLELDEKLND